MTRRGACMRIAAVGATVAHPLWPELGTGEVLAISMHTPNHTSYATGRICWSTGQVSTHNLSVLREVES